MKWNMFSNEVAEERRRIEAYGRGTDGSFKHDKMPGNRVDTYKEQALVELSKRLILEDELKEKNQVLARLVDFFDGVAPAEMAAMSGWTVEACEELKKSF